MRAILSHRSDHRLKILLIWIINIFNHLWIHFLNWIFYRTSPLNLIFYWTHLTNDNLFINICLRFLRARTRRSIILKIRIMNIAIWNWLNILLINLFSIVLVFLSILNNLLLWKIIFLRWYWSILLKLFF